MENLEAPNKLPWWTWFAPLVLLHLGSQFSLLFKYDQGVAFVYLPTAISIILVNWWGPKRVIPAVYINAALSTYFWGVENPLLWLVFAIPETLLTTASWLLFTHLIKGKYWLPDVKQTIYFIILAVVIPIMVELPLLEFFVIYFLDRTTDSFLQMISMNFLAEFTTCFGFTMPFLYYGTWHMHQRGLLIYTPRDITPIIKAQRKDIIILITLFGLLTLLTFVLDFNRFWFIYAIIPLSVAIIYGFGFAIATNFYIYSITYIGPNLIKSLMGVELQMEESLLYVFLGTSMLYLSSAVTGRVISDLRNIEAKLLKNNRELEQTNQELDRFVYSASHDLSAPLKSILGLINISKIDNSIESGKTYLSEIEKSVKKLENFIGEILDYSRNKRLEIVPEQIRLKELCEEILENLKYTDHYNQVVFDLSSLTDKQIIQDKTRLKIILSNLISNAIKFQKTNPEHHPLIKISAENNRNFVAIKVEDNGEGVRPESSKKIFDMFYRASDSAKGSGLGLYIARETANHIGGKISVTSEYGKGSEFVLEVPELINFRSSLN